MHSSGGFSLTLGCHGVVLTHVGQVNVHKEVNFNHLCNKFEDALGRRDERALNAIKEEASIACQIDLAESISKITAEYTHACICI